MLSRWKNGVEQTRSTPSNCFGSLVEWATDLRRSPQRPHVKLSMRFPMRSERDVIVIDRGVRVFGVGAGLTILLAVQKVDRANDDLSAVHLLPGVLVVP